ncbi:MAG: indolepyruvate ferredoxin oxidoreductase family protein [Gammaproteobacteria bacterium]|nr:indolepyruvate ferredoxin oxidoreductase family protein [Gammaproteobacteria bacterium]
MIEVPNRLREITLAQKYALDEHEVWLTGTQGLVRMVLEQSRADTLAGRHTAGFVSGYRGSPLAGVDLEFGRGAAELRAANVRFQPAINEDLAATAIWGSQQVGLFHGKRYDGVYGLWYGKSPGLDRSADAIRHANMAGTAPLGGVLAVVGDDPDCKSSTLPSDSAGLLRDLQLPILDPTDINELIDFGLYGWALSRFTGLWTALLAQTSVMDSSATIKRSPAAQFEFPHFEFDPHIRLGDTPYEQEERITQKLALVRMFQEANPLNNVAVEAPDPKLAIITTGKSYTNVRQALHLLGLSSDTDIERASIRLIKLGLLWPIDHGWLRTHVHGARSILVIESKGAFLETELKAALYGHEALPILGKRDLDGSPLLSPFGELQVDAMIQALATIGPKLKLELPRLDHYANRPSGDAQALASMNVNRKPLFCPGCPHSGSTKLPEGSRAFAGIGCHYMAQWMHRETYLFTHMGGEGANWIGQAPFTDTNHVFVNLGDGTYSHSGLLAIRAAVAAGVNVTYKILFNDAVAMTGGQPVEGDLTVANVVAQVRAEGVGDVHVVADDLSLHRKVNYKVSGRASLDAVQRRLRSIEGCTVLIVDHACATEKRRKRKRGLAPPPSRYVVINEEVCEGCGDCVVTSGCSAIKTVQTAFGEKRQIEQAHCIQDGACVDGYCPALVEVQGNPPPLHEMDVGWIAPKDPPEVSVPDAANLLIAGVGGTGVITVSQILAIAAHLDGKQASSLDMTGLAQKGGAVISHIRIAPEHVWRTRIAECEADTLIAGDAVTATSREVVPLLARDRTCAVVNDKLTPSYRSVVDHDEDHVVTNVVAELRHWVGQVTTFDAVAAAEHHTGSGTYANIAMLGFAYQQGLVPVSLASLRRAIELNDVAVEKNLKAFDAGRFAATESKGHETSDDSNQAAAESLKTFIGTREKRLAAYQDAALGRRYSDELQLVQRIDSQFQYGEFKLTWVAAGELYRFLAVKDEYEVARLLTQYDFERDIRRRFDDAKIGYAFAPTWLRKDLTKGKLRFGSWFRPVLRVIAGLRALRGGWFDPFRTSRERELDRLLLDTFRDDLEFVLNHVTEESYTHSVALLGAYQDVKGFGYVREENWQHVSERLKVLRARFIEGVSPRVLATDSA